MIMNFPNAFIKAHLAFLLLAGMLTLSACQTNNVENAEDDTSPTVTTTTQSKPSQGIKQKPFDEDQDPNDMENNPFAFNRM